MARLTGRNSSTLPPSSTGSARAATRSHAISVGCQRFGSMSARCSTSKTPKFWSGPTSTIPCVPQLRSCCGYAPARAPSTAQRMAPQRRPERAYRKLAHDARGHRRRRELRLPALAVFQLVPLRTIAHGSRRSGCRVRRLDRLASTRSRASQDPRDDFSRHVRDFPGRLHIRAPLQLAPSRDARAFLPLDYFREAAACVARRRCRRSISTGNDRQRDDAWRPAMGDCRLPSAAQRLLRQLPALADHYDPAELRSHILHRAELRQSVPRSSRRVGCRHSVHADFFHPARPRHQPGDGQILCRVSPDRSGQGHHLRPVLYLVSRAGRKFQIAALGLAAAAWLPHTPVAYLAGSSCCTR